MNRDGSKVVPLSKYCMREGIIRGGMIAYEANGRSSSLAKFFNLDVFVRVVGLEQKATLNLFAQQSKIYLGFIRKFII